MISVCIRKKMPSHLKPSYASINNGPRLIPAVMSTQVSLDRSSPNASCQALADGVTKPLAGWAIGNEERANPLLVNDHWMIVLSRLKPTYIYVSNNLTAHSGGNENINFIRHHLATPIQSSLNCRGYKATGRLGVDSCICAGFTNVQTTQSKDYRCNQPKCIHPGHR